MSDFELVHVDDSLLVLDKPTGLLAVPGRGLDKQDCLSTRVQSRYPDALIVHRLDMATSGLVVMARGTRAQSLLSRAFEARRVEKRYIALVRGRLQQPGSDWGEITLPIGADWPNRPRQKVDLEQGKHSLTRWRVLGYEAGGLVTRVELEPLTGRTHQLRVHLLALGHPIVGDELYAPGVPTGRMMLHAWTLSLEHPVHGGQCRFEAPLPY